MKNIRIALIIGVLCLTAPVVRAETSPTPSIPSNPTTAVNSQHYNDLENQIKELEGKLQETQNRGKTLASEIAYMDNQIKRAILQIGLTEQKITDLQDEISSLSGKIDRLEGSLTKLSDVLLNRIVITYKRGIASPLEILFSSDSFGDFILRYKLLRTAQANDKMLMFEMQQTKDVFSEQKAAREDKKKQQEVLQLQLKKQKTDLDAQKINKANLLAVTKNDEKKYQELLDQARAEFEAIQAITAGKGDETSVGHVNEGDKIASIIQGPSCNSGGAHLHFMVKQGSNVQNPFSYLKGGINFDNCSGSSCGSSDGDPFNPGGNWVWPISPPIKYSQGYGATWATRNSWVGRVYSFHNGIDINSDSSDIRAVKSGVLYRGSYAGINGCRLRYVHVVHDDGGVETLYLHVNY